MFTQSEFIKRRNEDREFDGFSPIPKEQEARYYEAWLQDRTTLDPVGKVCSALEDLHFAVEDGLTGTVRERVIQLTNELEDLADWFKEREKRRFKANNPFSTDEEFEAYWQALGEPRQALQAGETVCEARRV